MNLSKNMFPIALRRTVLILLFAILPLAGAAAGDVEVRGPQGALSAIITLPDGFNTESCQAGRFFNARFDPKDPPQYIRCWLINKLGREYLVSTQTLDIFGTASAYKGRVCILHGNKDRIVPLWCSERYKETYGDQAELTIVNGENHTINRRRAEVVSRTVAFFRSIFLIPFTSA